MNRIARIAAALRNAWRALNDFIERAHQPVEPCQHELPDGTLCGLSRRCIQCQMDDNIRGLG